jgi:aryl-alcohol dehydrogenase-like predicted oxidoreductase
MQSRTLGSQGLEVSAIGLGCMGMSDLYGPADEAESIATIHAALDSGVTLLDTGDYYGMGHNELLIREALRGRPRDRIRISVKFGALRDVAGNWTGIDARPVSVKNFIAYTLRRLGTDYVDVYRPGRLDPDEEASNNSMAAAGSSAAVSSCCSSSTAVQRKWRSGAWTSTARAWCASRVARL